MFLSIEIRFGKPITVDQYESQFLSDEEGAARTCAKDLTRQIKSQMLSLTINAPDWYVLPITEPFIALYFFYRETLYSAKMARSLLWPRARSLNLDDFVTVSQV
jgi:hypothetical protein